MNKGLAAWRFHILGILVVGYGSSVRRDDGVGPAAAELAEAQLPPEARVLAPPQLLPELAEDVSRAACVILIDASSEGVPGTVRVEPVQRESWSPALFGHQLRPGLLLGLVWELYGVAPPTFLISVSGSDYDFGQELSPPVREALPRVLAEVKRITSGYA